LYELSADDRYQLTQESDWISRALVSLFSPDKLNIAVIGNMVPQLHMHHVCRFRNDACWPKPVWGQVPATAYTNTEIAAIIKNVSGKLTSCDLTSS